MSIRRLAQISLALLLLCAGGLSFGPGYAQSAPLPPGSSDNSAAPPLPATPDPAAGEEKEPPRPLTEAEARLAERDYPGAKTLLDPYLSAHPADARALFDRGYVADAQGEAQAAEGYYRKAIAADPQQFESRLALGLLLARSGASSAGEARTQLDAATKLSPKPANPAALAQANRALARLIYAADPEDARQAMLAALKLSPETTADTLLTAEIAEAAGDQETAEQAYRGVLAAAPEGGSDDAKQATAGLAHLLIEQKKYPESELLVRKALVRNATDPVLNAQLATILMAEGKPEEAAAVLENLRRQQPDDRAIATLLADCYTQTGQAEKADPIYVQLLASPEAAHDERLLAARGDNLVRQKRFADALPVLQQAVKLDPGDGAAWSSLAFAASVSHQPQLTLDALAMRSKVMPETPATYFLAATAYDSLHLSKRAVELYRQFLAVAGGKFPDEEWQAKHRLVALPH